MSAMKSSTTASTTLGSHERAVYSVVVLPNGRLASGSADNTIRIWNLETGECLRVLEGHTDWVHTLAVLPNGYLVSASGDNTIRIWDTVSGDCVQILKGHTRLVTSLAVLPNGHLVSGSADNTTRIWDTSDIPKEISLKNLDELIVEFRRVKSEKEELAKKLEEYDALKAQYNCLESQCKDISLKIKGILDV